MVRNNIRIFILSGLLIFQSTSYGFWGISSTAFKNSLVSVLGSVKNHKLITCLGTGAGLLATLIIGKTIYDEITKHTLSRELMRYAVTNNNLFLTRIATLTIGSEINASLPPLGFHGTPLYWAASQGYFNIVKYLVEKGADVDKTVPPIPRGDKYHYALSGALAHDRYDIALYLASRSRRTSYASPGFTICSHDTPLQMAAAKGQIEIVKVLIQNGINKDETSRTNETPASGIARQYGHTDLANYLDGLSQ